MQRDGKRPDRHQTRHQTRRQILGGLTAGLGVGIASSLSPLQARAPERSLFPQPRIARLDGRGGTTLTAQPLDALLARARLGGTTAFVALDLRDGSVIEAMNAGTAMPPASVAKAATALYAIDHLGASHRFATQVLASGTVSEGVLQGDLILQGGGDPVLQTADLAELAQALVTGGLRRVTGRFLTDDTALPHMREIAGNMPVQAGYNPALSGLNLNFNRVHFVWRPEGGAMRLSLDARSAHEVPPVSVIGIEAHQGSTPVYTYRETGGREMWSVAAGALGQGGSRWLPVRRPGVYAGDVLRALLAARGCTVPPPQAASRAQTGRVLASHMSPPLDRMMRDMLRFSTNITAEIGGLAATRQAGGAGVGTLAASGQRMSAWVRSRHGVQDLRFDDHSGLNDTARVTAQGMAAFLQSAHRQGVLPPLLRRHVMRDTQGAELPGHPVQVNAKTGTLNFVSGLGGYARIPGGREIAFAIFSADLARRAAIPADQAERPADAPGWARRARTLQQGLIERWAALHA